MAPDVKDMKALATALKLAAAFNTPDRLAHEWIERDKRSLKPEDLESDERREWYDLRDSWENAIKSLRNKVDKFRLDTGFSPILRYWRQVGSMGEVGKVYLGYDSAQAKGYRIIEITFPVWFEELNLPTEEMSEEDVYKLVPVERLSDEQEQTLYEDFLEDLRQGGIDFTARPGVAQQTEAFRRRFDSTIDKRRTYNENVFRVDALVQAIIREHALAVAKPPGGPIVPVTELPWRANVVPVEFQGRVIFVDAGIKDILQQIWKCGFKTTYSCSGLREDHEPFISAIHPYVQFEGHEPPLKLAIERAGWQPFQYEDEVSFRGFAKLPHGLTDDDIKQSWANLVKEVCGIAPTAMPIREVKREIPSYVWVKLRVEEGMNLGEYFVHLFHDSFEVMFSGVLSTQALKDYLEEKEEYYDSREMLSFQGLSEGDVEAELKKMPWPFSSGEEIKLVWTPGDIEFTPKAMEWWNAFNKTYTRNELEAFDVERLKTIAKLKGVKVGKDKAEAVAYILGELPAKVNLPTTDLLMSLISAMEPVDEPLLKVKIKNSDYDAYSVDGERAFRAALGELLRSGKVFEPRPGWYQRTEKPELVEAMKKAAAETKAKLEEFEQLKKLGGIPPGAAKPPAAARPLTTAEISKLQDVYSDALFRQLGRVPPNALATFRVEIDKVKDKSYAEAQDHILGVANDIVGGFVAREGIERITPARRFEPERPAEEPIVMGRVPPAQPPKEPLEPEEMKFPRAPSRKEKEVFWNSFRYRLQEQGFNAFDFTDQFEEYIEKSQFASWRDLLTKFEYFTKSIMEGKALPPLWSWRGAPIPVGLEGVIRKTPAERLDDLIVHYTSVVIRNARSRDREAALGDLQKELEERGIIPSDMIITPTSPLFTEIRNAVMDAYKRKDDWFTNISLEELSRFLET